MMQVKASEKWMSGPEELCTCWNQSDSLKGSGWCLLQEGVRGKYLEGATEAIEYFEPWNQMVQSIALENSEDESWRENGPDMAFYGCQ